MLSNRVGRFFAWVLSVVAAIILMFIITSIATNISSNLDSMGLIMSLMAALLIAFIHQFNDDLLNFSFMDNIVFKTIKRILFYSAVVVCAFLSYMLFFERVYGEFFEELLYCMMIPAPFSAAILCIWADGNDWDKERLPFIAYISLIPTLAIALVLALIGPDFYIAGEIIVVLLGLAAIVFLTFKFGFIYSEGEGYNPFKKKKRKEKPQNTSKMPTALFNKLHDEMKSIINRYSGTKYLGYGIKLKLSGYSIVYDESATIYVDADFYLGGSTATSEWQFKSAVQEANSYQESQMSKMYSELERVLNRLLPQYNYNVHFSYGVKPGHSQTHDSY